MDKSDELLKVNTTLADRAIEENVVDPEPIPDYITRKLPNEAVNEIVNRFQIPKTVTPTSSIKTNRDIPLDGVKDPVDISSLPIQDDVKDSEERNIVGNAYREAEESLTTGDKYTLHSITSKRYFLEKITQYKSLYDESGDELLERWRAISGIHLARRLNGAT